MFGFFKRKKKRKRKVSAQRRKRRKSAHKKPSFFERFKSSIKSKAAKAIVALSALSVFTPSLYSWGKEQVIGGLNHARPAAEKVLEQAIQSSPPSVAKVLTKVQAGLEYASVYSFQSGVDQGSNAKRAGAAKKNDKVDEINNPFF